MNKIVDWRKSPALMVWVNHQACCSDHVPKLIEIGFTGIGIPLVCYIEKNWRESEWVRVPKDVCTELEKYAGI